MEKSLSCLYPKIQEGKVATNAEETAEIGQSDLTKGSHCILELYECDRQKLNDEAFVRTLLTNSSRLAGATLINLITHRFQPQGVTGLALLAESHISIHTWPEIGYAAIDVFTCGDHTMPEKACSLMRKELLAKDYNLKTIKRFPKRCLD
tara:strand:+ start:661 stop:1110 length:450 start_codon:yes stop_codon:yes gene_type:complete